MNTIGFLGPFSQSAYNNYNSNKNSSESDICFNLELANQQKEQQEKDEYVKSLSNTSSNQEIYNLSTLETSVSDKLKASFSEKPEDASGSIASISMLLNELYSSGGVPIKYNDMPFSLNTETNVLSIGGHTKGAHQITVNNLSIGVSLTFDRSNVDQIAKMLHLFSPSDVNKILEAIQLDNIATAAQAEDEENSDNACGKIANQLNNSTDIQTDDSTQYVPNISIEKDLEVIDYDPNDLSLGVTFADKNSKIVPTLNSDIKKSDSANTSETNSTIHTDENGTRFLIISTTVGNQTFEKSIKLSDNIQSSDNIQLSNTNQLINNVQQNNNI